MATAKSQILELVGDDAYPLSKAELITLLEDADVEPDVLGMAMGIADERFVTRAELEFRLDDALGMPDADPRTDSALVGDPEWPTTDP